MRTFEVAVPESMARLSPETKSQWLVGGTATALLAVAMLLLAALALVIWRSQGQIEPRMVRLIGAGSLLGIGLILAAAGTVNAKLLRCRRVEKDLAASELRFRMLADATCEALAIHEAGRVLDVNDAFCALVRRRREELIGTDLLALLAPEARDEARARSLSGWSAPYRSLGLRRDGTTLPIEISGRQVTYQGRSARIVVVRDLAAAEAAQTALAESEQRLQLALEGARMAIWEWDLRTGDTVWSPRLYELIDLPASETREGDARSFFERVHPDDRPGLDAALAQALEGDGHYAHEFRIVLPNGTVRWLAGSGRVERDAAGQPMRMLGVNWDITERKEAEERQALLGRELGHRVKNSLAVVQSIAHLTGRQAGSLEEFLHAFGGRLQALAAANQLLRGESWRAAGLRALIRQALEPHGIEVNGGRFALAVTDLPVPAALTQDLTLVLHELATNAAKYGALSVPQGRVLIEAGPMNPGSADPMLRLVWREEGGPPVVPPKRQGFGTRLLRQAIAGQGRLDLAWRPTGLVCTIEVPLLQPESDGKDAPAPAA
jgi:PAS domain S-box-containing protein